MKRDPDLARDILFATKAYDGEPLPGYTNLSDHDAPDLQEKQQIILLHEAGLVKTYP